MSLQRQLEDAVERLEIASARVSDLRARPDSPEAVREWLEALTDMISATSDIQALNDESIHEKLHALAARMGLENVI